MKRLWVVKFLVFMLINLLVGFGLYVISSPLWSRPIIAIGFESLAAVLSALSITAIILLNKTRKKSYILLATGFLYYSILEIGGAIEKQFLSVPPIVQKTPIVLLSDIIQIAFVALFFLAAVVFESKEPDQPISRDFHLKVLVLLVFVMSGQYVVRFVLSNMVNLEVISWISFLVLTVASVLLVSAAVLVILKHRLFEFVSSLRLAGALLMLMVSTIPSLLAINTGSTIWIMSNCIQIVAFFTLYVGLTIPYLRSKSQADSKNGDIFGYSVASLIIILLFITMVTELGWPHIQFFEPGIAAVVNIGSTVMLITITTFTFIYTNRTGTRFLIPLLFIYALWIAKGISQSILSDLLSYSTVDSLIPYIVVSVFSIPAFMLSSLMMNESRENEQEIKSASRWIIIGVFVGIISITLAEGVSYALVASSTVDSSPLGRSILLGLCLIAIAELTYISFKLYERNQGQVGLDSLAIALLSLWFIPSLLKGNFQAWTLGWWIGESVLLLGLLVAPAIIGIMYLDTSFRAQQSETRAKVYADLMAHDISNHHQVVMSTIELALLDSTPDFAREKTLKSALRTLFDADRLVRNVRKLGNLEVLSKSELYPCDLLTAISETFDMITKLYPEQTLNFVLEKPMENCKILANDLLPDIFQNLLLNAVEHSDGNTVDVEIELKTNDDSSIWEVRIVDYGPGISPDKRDELFTRYQKGARGTGLGLSLVQALTEFYDGTIRVEDRIPGDYRQGSSFVLQFPAIES